jgi:arabinogalactan oligomer/maltooligosaccharide transport system permease protein
VSSKVPSYAFALLVVLASAIGAARAQEPITLWHAYGGAEAEALHAAIDAYRREHPDPSIEVLGLPFGAYASKLEAAIPAGRGPDLFIDAHERLPEYRERDLLRSFARSDAAGLDEAQLRVLREGDRLYGLPIAVKCAVLYVNTALVDPARIASFRDVAVLRESLPKGSYPLVFEADNPYWLAAFLHAEGGELLDASGRYAFVGPSAERTLALLSQWSRAGVLPEEPNPEMAKRMFVSGHAATLISGPWLAADLPRALPFHVMALPPLAPGKRPLAPLVTIEAAFLGKATDRDPARAAAAEALARYLAVGPGAALRQGGGQVVAAQVGSPGYSQLDVFRMAARSGVPMSVHPHMRRVWEPAQRAARKVLRGDADIASALAEGRRRFDDAVRPLPQARSPRSLVLGLGFVLLLVSVALVRKASQPDMRRRLRASLPAYGYVAHAFVAVLLLVIAPLVTGALASFFTGRGTDLHYVGLANYVDILSARGGELLAPGSFWLVLLVTLLWTAANLVLHVALGVSIALVLSRVTGRLSQLYRVLLILPWAVPSYVTALAWKGMFHRQFGAVNALLAALGVEPVSWFARFSTAFSANLATNTWLGFPFMMVVTLGALTAIPKETYEAAEVDGAGPLDRLRFITLPMIRPVLVPAVAMGAVWTFNMFNVIFLVSGGEPDGSTEILVSEAYRWAFTRSSQVGYAAAYAVLIFGILLLGTRLMSPFLEEKRA